MSKSTPKPIQAQLPFPQSGPNPSGMCMCGCGQPAPIAKKTYKAKGHVKDQCVRFLVGHYARVQEWPTAEERFWANVNRNGPLHPVLGTACWDWTGSGNEDGYGQFQINKRNIAAHRFSYELHCGAIPDGMFVCHHCDRPSCCNWQHLFLGTPSDNLKDASLKGRLKIPHPKGVAHPQAKLTDSNVLEIRRRAAGGEKASAIARDFKVRVVTIYSIINRETWTHI